MTVYAANAYPYYFSMLPTNISCYHYHTHFIITHISSSLTQKVK